MQDACYEFELKWRRILIFDSQNDSIVLQWLRSFAGKRFRAVHAVLEQGKTQEDKLYREGGEQALKVKQRGRPAGGKLLGWQAATICNIIRDHCPDQLKLPSALWTREAVGQLIERKFGIKLSIWTVGRYLRRWNFTPQKLLKRAYERNPKEVKAWLEKEYPRIRKKAKEEGAEIWWGDETGIRSDHQAGRSWGKRQEISVQHDFSHQQPREAEIYDL